MLKRTYATLVLILAVSFLPSRIAFAQQSYNDPVREGFATRGCESGQWEDQGYSSYIDCWHDWYNSYPNQPVPGTE